MLNNLFYKEGQLPFFFTLDDVFFNPEKVQKFIWKPHSSTAEQINHRSILAQKQHSSAAAHERHSCTETASYKNSSVAQKQQIIKVTQ